MTDLSNLKVGDVVFRRASRYDDLWDRVAIIDETKTLWKTKTGEQFYKKNGFRAGDRRAYRFVSIHPITPELEAKVAEFEATKKLQALWNEILRLGRPTHITVERLQAIYDELKGEK